MAYCPRCQREDMLVRLSAGFYVEPCRATTSDSKRLCIACGFRGEPMAGHAPVITMSARRADREKEDKDDS